MASSQDLSPLASDPTLLTSTHLPTDNSFPIIAIAVIGILATGFLLVSYYVFVIKCCLNWHRVDLPRRFSASRRGDNPLISEYEVSSTARGLEKSVIRAIPIFKYKNNKGFGDKSFCECAVCLNEFQEEEKLRYIPNCSHVFHVDCIDVWLQNNANCPLCRTSISATTSQQTHVEHPASQMQRLSPLFGHPTLYDDSFTGNDEDYVIIDLPGRHSESAMDQSLLTSESERSNSGASSVTITPLPLLRPEQRSGFRKNRTRLSQISSKGDESIDIRPKDEKFDIQPIRRSFSLGSSDDQQLYLMVQEIAKQQNSDNNVADGEAVISLVSGEGCSNNKLRRSLFSFGSGRGSKSSILPVQLET